MKVTKFVFLIYVFIFLPDSTLFGQNKVEEKTEFKKKIEAANLLNTQSRYEISKNLLFFATYEVLEQLMSWLQSSNHRLLVVYLYFQN